MNTKKFRTRQEFITGRTNPKGKDFIIGLDLGYSSTKIFYESGNICFPSYAKKLDDNVTMPDEKDILYKDTESGDIYMVGYNAQNMIGASETNDTNTELYSRKRYNDTRFRIICNTAIGLATMDKVKSGDNRKIIIQTGLPSGYLEGDSAALKKALSNNMSFSLNVAGKGWIDFKFDLSPDDIFVIAQPRGALYSVITKPDGTFVKNQDPNQPDAKRILSGNTIVLDAGFGTFDFFGMIERNVVCRDSIDDIGMKAVLELTSKLIMEDTGEDIRVAAMQQYLASGKFKRIDDEAMRAIDCDISPYLKSANATVFEQAKKKIQSVTNSFRGYDNVIIDGGTGAAWYDGFKEWLSSMDLSIFPSDFNDHLGMLYSNARGYYMYRYSENKRN